MFERWEDPAPGLSLIIDNTSKAGREERSLVSAWVVHATHDWSNEHLESPPEHIESLMLKQTLKLLKTERHQLCYAKAHRWRYARVDQACSSDGYLWDADNQIGSCGDWCLGDGVEAAMTSGWRLARHMS